MRAKKIIVTGLVQGVGFRPHVYRLAIQHGLKGYVKNLGGSEVEIWVEGTEEKLNHFIQALRKNPPPGSLIENIIIKDRKPDGHKKFIIKQSDGIKEKRSMIPPDLSICDDCLREVLDPTSRFYMYPFHSCVRCGPRYSMLVRPPYDRINTSMNDFSLCSDCTKEYNDPYNERRFHAQGISCPRCGPKLRLESIDGEPVDTEDPLAQAAKLIDEGYIIAVKGIGGYHIASLATDDEVLRKLRDRKKRWRKPFALMALDLDVMKKHVLVDSVGEQLLLSRERPIVVLEKRKDSSISDLVAPGLGTLGIMLPYTAMHYLLLKHTRDKILVMTSGNPTGEPMCTDIKCVRKNLYGIVDYVLDHNRRIQNRVDDSIVRFSMGTPILLRRGRGYAPRWVRISIKTSRPIIALGSHLNNTGAVAFEDKVVLTPHIGDLDSYRALQDLFSTLNKYISWYRLYDKPILVMDSHPRYPQNRFWKKMLRTMEPQVVKVQHHQAHALQVMAEHGVVEGVAITIDGVGYGADGRIWGGEVLEIHGTRFYRRAMLEYQPLIWGDYAIRYPARFLLSYLYNVLGDSKEALRHYWRWVGDRGVLGEKITPEKYISFIEKIMYNKNHQLTSSIGRLLDAYSVLLGFSDYMEYDGEPAIRMEEASRHAVPADNIELKTTIKDGVSVIGTSSLLQSVIEALEEGIKAESIAYSIQFSLGEALGRAAANLTRDDKVYVCGGAAVNNIILEGIKEALKEKELKLILPRQTPPGDGGLSLGQAYYAVMLSHTMGS